MANSAINFGHTPDRLIEAATGQMRSLSQLTQLHQPNDRICRRAIGIFELARCGQSALQCEWGSAVETPALKIALRRRPGNNRCFEYGYHGRSLARNRFQMRRPFSAEYPWPGIWNATSADSLPYRQYSPALEVVSWIECLEAFGSSTCAGRLNLIRCLDRTDVGARGYIAPPDRFFQELQILFNDWLAS